MKFVYPARLRRTGPDEVVVSFRDLPECLGHSLVLPHSLQPHGR